MLGAYPNSRPLLRVATIAGDENARLSYRVRGSRPLCDARHADGASTARPATSTISGAFVECAEAMTLRLGHPWSGESRGRGHMARRPPTESTKTGRQPPQDSTPATAKMSAGLITSVGVAPGWAGHLTLFSREEGYERGGFSDFGLLQHWDGRLEVLAVGDDTGHLYHAYQLFDTWGSPVAAFPQNLGAVGYRGWSGVELLRPRQDSYLTAVDEPGVQSRDCVEESTLPYFVSVGSVLGSLVSGHEFEDWLRSGRKITQDNSARAGDFRTLTVPATLNGHRPVVLQYCVNLATPGINNYTIRLDDGYALGPNPTWLLQGLGPVHPMPNSGPPRARMDSFEANALGKRIDIVYGKSYAEAQWDVGGNYFPEFTSENGREMHVSFAFAPWPSQKIPKIDAKSIIALAYQRACRPPLIGWKDNMPEVRTWAWQRNLRQIEFTSSEKAPYVQLGFFLDWILHGLWLVHRPVAKGPVAVEKVWDFGEIKELSVVHRNGAHVFFLDSDGRPHVYDHELGAVSVAWGTTGFVSVHGARNLFGRMEMFLIAKDGSIHHAYEVDYMGNKWKWNSTIAPLLTPPGVRKAVKLRAATQINGALALVYLDDHGEIHVVVQASAY